MELRERLYNKSPEEKWLILGNEVQNLIRKKAKIKKGNILDTTKFLNHGVSPMFRFFGEIIANAYTQKYGDYITKILTVESSGNIFAGSTGFDFYKYTILAKKEIPITLIDEEIYSSEAESYTKGEKNRIVVEKSLVKPEDRILIVDDFIARGNATFALLDIINQAGAELAGIAAIITKDYKGQEGYKKLKKYINDYNINHENKASLNSLVKIKDMSTTPENIKFYKSPLILN